MIPRNDRHWSATPPRIIRTNPQPPRSFSFLVLAVAALSSTRVRGFSLPRPSTTTMTTTYSQRGHRGPHADPQPAPSVEAVDDDGAGSAFYVHIPYCRRRCHYCDFAIVPVGDVDVLGDDGGQRRGGVDADTGAADRGRGFEEMDLTYRQAVLTEIDLAARAAARTAVARSGPGPMRTMTPHALRPRLRSVYFGGGTPSLAPTDTLLLLLDAMREKFEVTPDAEITIEMDPGTFDVHKLRALASAGFNRVSLGVQSFDDDVLRRIGRVHTRRDVFESIDMLQSVGVTNFSIDLISGLPGVSLAKWAETLRTAGDLNPPHVSVYDLQVEPDTLFGRLYPDGRPDDEKDGGKSNVDFTPPGTASLSSLAQSVALAVDSVASPIPLPSASDCAFMYRYTSGYLRARGYDHYEISSYANASNGGDGGPSNTSDGNNRSRHNSIYWEPGADWFAAGLGATSCIGAKRFSRPRRMADYVQWVEEVVQASSENDGKVLRDGDPPGWAPPWILGTIPSSNSTDQNDEEVDHEEERQSRLADAVMTRLRTSDGLDLSWVRAEFGSDAVGHVLSGARLALDLDLASLSSPSRDGGDEGGGDDGGEEEDADAAVSGGVLRLMDPDGFLFSNTIISSIFAELGVA